MVDRTEFKGETYIAIGDTLYKKNPPCWDAVKRFGGKIEGMGALNDVFCVCWNRQGRTENKHQPWQAQYIKGE